MNATTAKSLQSCLTLCNPTDSSSLGFSREEYWSELPFPSPIHESEKWIESEVAQSCLTLSDPMDCSPPGFSVHVIFQARVLEWGATAFSIYKVYMLSIWSATFFLYSFIIWNKSYLDLSFRVSLVAQLVKNPPAMQETLVQFTG